jgi:hypothetical protein
VGNNCVSPHTTFQNRISKVQYTQFKELYILFLLLYILRRNCLLKEVIEGKIKGRIEVTGRRGRRRK